MTPLMSLKNISKSYDTGAARHLAISDLDLTIQTQDFFALQGPSGSGKSTLLNIIGLLEDINQGEIFFRSENILKLSAKNKDLLRRKDIGFIFQNFNLLPIFSALENVEYPLLLLNRMTKKQVKEKAEHTLAAVGLADFFHRFPSQLSGGQRQRVAIARALVKDPALILADEPTANLDQHNARQIIDLLCDLNTRHASTIVIATHDEKIAQRAKKVVYLEDGKILWEKLI